MQFCMADCSRKRGLAALKQHLQHCTCCPQDCLARSGLQACLKRYDPQQLIKGMYSEFVEVRGSTAAAVQCKGPGVCLGVSRTVAQQERGMRWALCQFMVFKS